MKSGIIRTSESAWRSRLTPVPKENKEIRLCVDYRRLNDITVKNAYPLPRIDEIFDTLSRAKIFSIVDATSGYHQIAMKEEDICKTAFAWKGQLYEYTRMPFRLCNAPATFQATMNVILGKDLWVYAIPYLDDIIIFSESLEQHKQHLDNILKKIKAAGLTLNHEKCKFFRTEIKYLGYVLSAGQIKPDPKKIAALQEFSEPTNMKELRSFLGLSNFCSQFIPRYATLISPLTDILQGESKSSQKNIVLSKVAKESFKYIKDKIAKIASRSQPDLNKEFTLITDASNTAMEAVLTQLDDQDRETIVSCFSKKFVKSQMNYSTTDKELLAIEKGIEHYKHYLLGNHFLLKTDHQALQYMKTASNDNSRILRIALKLQNYSFTPIYIKGETNIADIFSRPKDNLINNIFNDEYSEEEKFKILQKYHLISGHVSVSNLKFLLRKKYYWPSIFKDIEKLVSKCQVCVKSGDALVNTKNKAIRSAYPMKFGKLI